MKIAIGIFVVIGLLFWAWSKYVDGQQTNPDDYTALFLLYVAMMSGALAGTLALICAAMRLL